MSTVTVDAFDVAGLKAEVPEIAAADFDEVLEGALELANFDEASAQEALAGSKLVLAAAAGKIVATFDSKRGYGSCAKKGTGAFTGPKYLPSGTYDVVVTRTTAKLVQNGVQKWKGKGLEKGLTGTWQVKW